MVVKVAKRNGVWDITLNKEAAQLVKSGKAKIVLNISYCSYEGDKITMTGNTVQIAPDWTPATGKITVGVVTTAGYISSAIVR